MRYSMETAGEALHNPLQTMSLVDYSCLDRPRAKTVITGIFAVLASGGYIDRPFIIRRFVEGGYAEHLAIRYTDTLIARNTDIQHHSRWSIWGANGRETYSFAG